MHPFVGCSPLERYQFKQKIGEGTFGEVFRGICGESGRIVAVKRVIMPYEQQTDPVIRKRQEMDGIPVIVLREIKILKLMRHPNIVELIDIAVAKDSATDQRFKLHYVFPYIDHDLAGILVNHRIQLTVPMIKCYFQQMLEGIFYLHANRILHRDIKPANLLIGQDGILRIADFGLARPVDPELKGKYTPNVVTRFYRAPEICLVAKDYTTMVDMWSCGCIFAEMFRRKPILMGSTDLDQLLKIFDLVGTPTEDEYPGWYNYPGFAHLESLRFTVNIIYDVFHDLDPLCVDLIFKLLRLNPEHRLTAQTALEHDYFWTEPYPLAPHEIPQFDSCHEYDNRPSEKKDPLKVEMAQHMAREHQLHQQHLPPKRRKFDD